MAIVTMHPRDTDALLFLDETGTANYFTPTKLNEQKGLIAQGLKPTTSIVFGLGGVLILRNDYATFQATLSAIKRRHFGRDNFALHEYDIRKMKTPPFVVLKDDATWQGFYADLQALIDKTQFLVIVATIDKIEMQETYAAPLVPYHPYQYCLHVIIERVINEKTFGKTCRIVAEDRQAGVNNELSAELLRLEFMGGTIDGRPTVSPEEVRARIDPTIVFRLKRDFDAGLEFADLCCGPVTRWLHGLGSSTAREVLPLMMPRLRRSDNGQLRGYGVKCLPFYPKNCPA